VLALFFGRVYAGTRRIATRLSHPWWSGVGLGAIEHRAYEVIRAGRQSARIPRGKPVRVRHGRATVTGERTREMPLGR